MILLTPIDARPGPLHRTLPKAAPTAPQRALSTLYVLALALAFDYYLVIGGDRFQIALPFSLGSGAV